MTETDLNYNLLGSTISKDRWWKFLDIRDLSPTERSLFCVGSINLIYVVLQLIVAEKTGSLAMLSDAFHNLSDVGAAWVAFKCEKLRRQESSALPFGYLRMQVLGASINSICLVSLALYLILSALPLLFDPHVDGGFSPTIAFICVAAIGVFINLISSALLCFGGKDADGNPNFVHAHVGCSCGPGVSNQSGGECFDDCCAPVVLDEATLQVPFGFVKKKVRSNPIMDIETPSPPASLEIAQSSPNNTADKTKESNNDNRSIFKFGNMDENVMAVMIHSASDACSSLVVFLVGIIVLNINDGKGGSWTDYLDPIVTIVLSVIMAVAVRKLLVKCWNVLLECNALSQSEMKDLRDDLRSDVLLKKYGLEPVELIITDMDFDGKSRRASLVLACTSTNKALLSPPTSQYPIRLQDIRRRAKWLLKKKGVKWAVVEVRSGHDDNLVGIDEKDKPHLF